MCSCCHELVVTASLFLSLFQVYEKDFEDSVAVLGASVFFSSPKFSFPIVKVLSICTSAVCYCLNSSNMKWLVLTFTTV